MPDNAPQDPVVSFIRVCRLIVAFIRRRTFTEARSRAHSLYMEAAGYPGFQGRALMYLLECRVKQGDFLSLESLTRQAVALLRNSEFPASAMRTLRLYAQGLLQQGRIDEARAVLLEAVALEGEIKPRTEEDQKIFKRGQLENRVWQGFAELEAFDLKKAAEYRRAAEPFSVEGGFDPWNTGEYLLLDALVTLPVDTARARHLFEEAFAIFSSTDDPIEYDRARALDMWGRATGNVALVDQAITLYKQLPNATLARLAAEWKDTEGRALERTDTFMPAVIDVSDETLLKAVVAVQPEGAPLIVPGVNTRGKLREAWRLASRAPKASKMIMGESGTGKLLIAHALHAASPYAKGPFVRVGCNAIAQTLFESELFGYKKGAFTGATEDRPGKIESANGGTLFLDEIHQMSPEIAAKLLTVLDQRFVTPVGSSKAIPLDMHIIAATNVDLWELAAQGKFPIDLIYRFKLTITTTPLRERPEEVAVLAEHIVRHYADEANPPQPNCRLEPEALDVLTTHHWPGNIRDLDRLLQRAVVDTGNRPIDVAALIAAASEQKIDLGYKDPSRFFQPSESTGSPIFDLGVAELKRFLTSRDPVPLSTSAQLITESLLHEVVLRSDELSKGNMTAAAALCGMKYNTFRDVLRKYREAMAQRASGGDDDTSGLSKGASRP